MTKENKFALAKFVINERINKIINTRDSLNMDICSVFRYFKETGTTTPSSGRCFLAEYLLVLFASIQSRTRVVTFVCELRFMNACLLKVRISYSKPSYYALDWNTGDLLRLLECV